MDGCRVVQVEEVAHKIDIVVTATGNKKVITRDHMDKMKSGTILANMGHANTEIDILSLKSSEIIWEKVILRTYIILDPYFFHIFLLFKIRYMVNQLNLTITKVKFILENG